MNIMIIDDIKSSRTILEKIIQGSFKCEVRSAESGTEAFILMQSFVPDLILLDVVMPKMSGLEFYKILRSTKEWKNTPVVVISGQEEKSVLSNFASMDVSGYLFKPFSAQDVERVVKILLKEPKVY